MATETVEKFPPRFADTIPTLILLVTMSRATVMYAAGVPMKIIPPAMVMNGEDAATQLSRIILRATGRVIQPAKTARSPILLPV